MWILKGTLLGMLMFAIIFGMQFHKVFWRSMVATNYLRQITIHSVPFWFRLVGFVMVGLTIVWYWTPSAWPNQVTRVKLRSSLCG